MKTHTLYCTEDQTRKAFKLGAPLIPVKPSSLFPLVQLSDGLFYPIPTSDEIIMWLEEQGVFVSVLYGYEVSDKWAYDLDGNEYFEYKASGEYSSRKDAVFAAIDAALECLDNKKN